MKFFKFAGRIKLQGIFTLIIIRINQGKLLAAMAKKPLEDLMIPFQGIKNTDGFLRDDNSLRQLMDNVPVILVPWRNH